MSDEELSPKFPEANGPLDPLLRAELISETLGLVDRFNQEPFPQDKREYADPIIRALSLKLNSGEPGLDESARAHLRKMLALSYVAATPKELISADKKVGTNPDVPAAKEFEEYLDLDNRHLPEAWKLAEVDVNRLCGLIGEVEEQ